MISLTFVGSEPNRVGRQMIISTKPNVLLNIPYNLCHPKPPAVGAPLARRAKDIRDSSHLSAFGMTVAWSDSHKSLLILDLCDTLFAEQVIQCFTQ